ncbi:N-acetylmuramoyl-L-alanine amidase [Saxibacter everestensis]|uniref:N-acetylmuramoyl-L-alanine amidase n=1 Tax=Saxibacter everestensis TaxID=2909229 RepID=A0ABY8QYQ5_9MICO|nr:N-acetylmuramoyl-L-alanine amidase [Brevibacteriaceae bacterium ZFBP1038]
MKVAGRLGALGTVGLLVVLGACASTQTDAPPTVAPTDSRPSTTGASQQPSDQSSASGRPERPEPAETESDPPEALAGLTVALDPGHNGGNGRHPAKIAEQVPDGRGGTKACNTTGTSARTGYPEHKFTWDVAKRTRELLEDAGAKVVMTRDNDKGVGPCVDKRGKFAAAQDADIMVSIHANGSDNAAAKGFHVIVAHPALNKSQGKDSEAVAEAMAKAMNGAGFPVNANYGKDGIVKRPDLAGLNHASRPAVIVECGEMRNPDQAAEMDSRAGRQKYAAALADGVHRWADTR